MKKNIHSSLGYLTPDEYEKQWNEYNKENNNLEEEFS